MVTRFLQTLYRGGRLRSLRGKLLAPIIGLMVISLLASTAAFTIGTAMTQTQLLHQQVSGEARQVTQALLSRVAEIEIAAELLANDPLAKDAIQSEGTPAMQTLNQRAVVIRDRFDLDLIQVYDAANTPRANLVLSSLYRESSLLSLVATDSVHIVAIDGRILILKNRSIPNGLGTIVMGIDLASELNRMASAFRLSSELGLEFEDTRVATAKDIVFNTTAESPGELFIQKTTVEIGSESMGLSLARPATDIAQVTGTGRTVMIVSTLLTTALLILLSIVITRLIARPILRLSTAAEEVARGNLHNQVNLKNLTFSFGIGDNDELGLLAASFNSMVVQLRDLYGHLEAKVAARTLELQTAADTARAVSASLDLEKVLNESVTIIQRQLSLSHVSVFLIKRSANAVVARSAAGIGAAALLAEEVQLTIGSRSMVGTTAATGKPRVSQNVQNDPFFHHLSTLPGVGAAAAVPLHAGEVLMGVLYVQNETPHSLHPDMVNLLDTLADQIAVGVQNAHLYEKQREIAEHLAKVDRLKTEFLANMSHELRTPLNSIIGFSKILLKGLEGPLTEAQAQELQIINNAGQHLLSLINDMLDISRINAGKVDLIYEAVDLSGIIASAIATTAPLIKEKPITLRTEIAEELPMLYADRRRIKQIMLNLLSNAAKFTEQGAITVYARKTEAINPVTERLESMVEIQVHDTGIGIPRDKLSEIFKEFTQVDSSMTRRTGGTGLGLSITKKLVELHGGSIWVESEVGKGSHFGIQLPLNTPDSSVSLELKEALTQGVSYAH
ncbi:MAG: GAF domain-containing protein [Anaerolineae bacterium]|nr:GAF domain-containing protein [Anaerolineae bacterium]